MRTTDEIVARLKDENYHDLFGTTQGDLLAALPFEHAKPFLKETTTEEEWTKAELTLTDEAVRAEMIKYMPFAWEKANGFRGLSAGRSMLHYSTWLWLLGEDALSEEIQDYEFYGKPQLVKICEFLGLDPKQWDDGVRSNTEE